MNVKYDSNNSGGSWWLDDADWIALEKAGWKVNWVRDEEICGKREDRWLGALATSAEREGLPLMEAVEEWESVTGKCSTEVGCPCCGNPHNFTLYGDDGEWIDSGPHVSHSASW